MSLEPLPVDSTAWLRPFYFDLDEEAAGWLVRRYNRVLDKEPLRARGWLAQLARERSGDRRGVRWYESFTFRNPEGFADGDLAACAPSSFDLFHLFVEEEGVGWRPNVTLDPALVGRWTGTRSTDVVPVTMAFGGDASFEWQPRLGVSARARVWCVYDGGAALKLRLCEQPGEPAFECAVVPRSSTDLVLILEEGRIELTWDGAPRPATYVGEWLSGGEVRARATGLRLCERAGDRRRFVASVNLRKLLEVQGVAKAALDPMLLERDLGAPLCARYAEVAREKAEHAAQLGNDLAAAALRRDAAHAADRIALAGDRFVIAPHPALHDEVARSATAWLEAALSG